MGEGSRQRVLDALNRKVPDKVPYMYAIIQQGIREQIYGGRLDYPYPKPKAEFGPIGVLGKQGKMEPAEAIDARVAEILGLDAIGMRYYPPFYVTTGDGKNGCQVTGGLLTEGVSGNR